MFGLVVHDEIVKKKKNLIWWNGYGWDIDVDS